MFLKTYVCNFFFTNRWRSCRITECNFVIRVHCNLNFFSHVCTATHSRFGRDAERARINTSENFFQNWSSSSSILIITIFEIQSVQVSKKWGKSKMVIADKNSEQKLNSCQDTQTDNIIKTGLKHVWFDGRNGIVMDRRGYEIWPLLVQSGCIEVCPNPNVYEIAR